MRDELKRQGAFSWTELMTTDVGAAKRFYAELLGWEMEDAPMPGMTYTTVKVAGQEVGGIMARPPEAEGVPPVWATYITVDDVDATAQKATELGGAVHVPPTDIPKVGRFSVIADPQGAVFHVIKYAE